MLRLLVAFAHIVARLGAAGALAPPRPPAGRGRTMTRDLASSPGPVPPPSAAAAADGTSVSRRDLLLGGASAAAAALSSASHLSFFVPPASAAAPTLPPPASPPPPIMGRGGVPGPRIEGIGGGFDVLSPPPSAVAPSSDVIYPSSLLGTWRVSRARSITEGDLGMAGVAWRLMGGADDRVFAFELDESYDVQFVEAPDSITNAVYDFEGKTVRGAVMDRGYELSSRKGAKFASDVRWDASNPNVLRYVDGFNEPVELAVVQRRVEMPSAGAAPGFGSDELIRITASPGGLLGSAAGPVVRAARVRRRYRRAFDEEGNRIVEGLEIVTTYRVLDGVAGIEMPTSTTKSRIRMTRQQKE